MGTLEVMGSFSLTAVVRGLSGVLGCPYVVEDWAQLGMLGGQYLQDEELTGGWT